MTVLEGFKYRQKSYGPRGVLSESIFDLCDSVVLSGANVQKRTALRRSNGISCCRLCATKAALEKQNRKR